VIEKALKKNSQILALPELCLSGYTCGDLFLQRTLTASVEENLLKIADFLKGKDILVVLGAPLRIQSKLYNTAVFLKDGQILGVVPKTNIPAYSEFYETRHFASGPSKPCRIKIGGQETWFGTHLLFACENIPDLVIAAEICEDLWVAAPPSSQLALAGATTIFNLSASPETAGKHDYLRTLVAQQSARTLSAYVYCSAGAGESSTDLVFAGNALIAENGTILRESERFATEEQLVVADVDIERLETERRRTTTFRTEEAAAETTVVELEIAESLRTETLDRDIAPLPFVPSDAARRGTRCEEILSIQSCGLAQRLRHTGCTCAVLGISGGLDSTLALLVAVRTFDRLGLDRKGIVGITMPGFGTTDRTHRNAVELMRELGVDAREIPIRKACEQHFADIGLDPADRSAAYENAQARERTQILMDVANAVGGLVIGTGDLSELALGWATYNGDHMSMYGLNASVPKTLVRHLVAWAADAAGGRIRDILLDICDTPVSPELLPADEAGGIAQRTEELVGPYELHDFFLYHFVRSGFGPAKLLYLAQSAFRGRYDRRTILRWMRTFFRRFFAQQFKRSAMPDGPKVGSVSLSPRGDWRMPSDASAAVWLAQLDELEEAG
ncbi:MAG TPA: NAD(+) synthase, partial [Alistipes sp.]|nr:NAD(+) synthase [Alistipes sp.]